MNEFKNLAGNKFETNMHGEITLSIIGGKWKFKILNLLADGPKRFNEIQKLLQNISPKTLATQLKSLENYQIINRKEFYQVPPKVVYSMSNIGKTLIPTLNVLSEWGKRYSASVNKTL